MKFVSSAPRLVRAIQAAGSLAPGTGKRFQIESTLLTVNDDGSLEVQATDLSDSYWFRVEPEPGAPFIPGKVFVTSANLVRSIKEAGKNSITIETVGKNHACAQISWGETKVKLPTEMVEDAPAIRRARPEDPCIQLPALTLIAILKRVNFAVSEDFKNRAMSFVRIESRPKTIKFTATDGIQMGSVEVDVIKPEDYLGTTYVLPIKPQRVKLLVDGEEETIVRFRISPDLLSISTASSEMTVRPGVASWADFDIEKQLPCEKRVMVPTAELKALLKAAELLKVKGEMTCEFSWTETGLTMDAVAAIEGSVISSIKVPWTHGPFKIKLDSGYFRGAVGACDADDVELGFSRHEDPMVLREQLDGFLYLFALGARY